MDIVAGSGNDEFYTPRYAIRPILKYLKPNSIIWCPFDTDESLFKELLEEQGHTVYCTHLSDGESGNFFNIETPKALDYIISNPPYRLKNEVFTNLFEIGVPFGMLVGVVGLFESQKRFELFKNNKFEVMYFNKRISYFKDYDDQKPALNPPFSSVYVCSGILPNQIVFEELDKKDL